MKRSIERMTLNGIKTSDKEYEFDIINYATGFDARAGSFKRIDIRGSDGLRLKHKWARGRGGLSRCPGRGFPQHDHAGRVAHGALQHSPQHRVQRRMDGGP
jgi:hypothetical protein